MSEEQFEIRGKEIFYKVDLGKGKTFTVQGVCPEGWESHRHEKEGLQWIELTDKDNNTIQIYALKIPDRLQSKGENAPTDADWFYEVLYYADLDRLDYQHIDLNKFLLPNFDNRLCYNLEIEAEFFRRVDLIRVDEYDLMLVVDTILTDKEKWEIVEGVVLTLQAVKGKTSKS